MDKVELRNRLTPGGMLVAAVKLVFGLAIIGLALGGVTRGSAVVVVLVGVLAIGMGLYDLVRLSDRKVQITLTPEGLLDHRMTRPLLLPWSAVEKIFHDSTNGHSLQITVSGIDPARFDGPGTSKSLLSGKVVVVLLEYVDVSFDGIERAVHGVAPGVVFSSMTRKKHDAQGRVR